MKKQKIVFFGGGQYAQEIYEQKEQKVEAVIDNKKAGIWKKEGGEIIPYISLKEYLLKYKEHKIWITSKKYLDEIVEQLEKENIYNYEIPSEFFASKDVLIDQDIIHEAWPEYLKNNFDKKGNKILEIGSRVQTGANHRGLFENATYIGFDLYEGENVDVIGDAHTLTKYFDEKFDLIFSSAVFEHLAMPWIVSLEIIKLLKPNGHIFIETHYSYSSHERPWHFFQYSENALNVLFPECFGMECVKKSCSNLLSNAQFSDQASEYLQGKYVYGLYCHSEFLGKKIREVPIEELDWSRVSLKDVVGATRYPYHEKKYI